MSDVTQVVVYTLTIGSIYGLVGFGYSLIFSTTRIVNFAQGTLVLVGGYLAWDLYANAFNGDVALPIILILVILLSALIGLLVDLVGVAPLGRFDPRTNVSWLVTTFGLGIVAEELVRRYISDSSQTLPGLVRTLPVFGAKRLPFGVAVSASDVLLVVIPIVVVVLLEVLQARTRLGRAFRAVAQDRQAASLMGINPTLMVMIAFALAGALAGLAGVLVAPRLNVRFNISVTLGVYGFIAAVIGGLGSTRGAMIGGYLIAFIEAFTGVWNPFSSGEVYKPIFVFVIFIAILAVRPSGLFGKKIVEKV